MRATVNGIDVEGTPEEIAAFIKAHRSSEHVPAPESHAAGENRSSDDRFASERIAYRALQRRPLSVAQRALFRTLLETHPQWVKASELQAAIGYGPNQFGGLLGTIGRRLSQTEGYVRDSAMFEWVWDADANEYAYRLPQSVLHAVRRIEP